MWHRTSQIYQACSLIPLNGLVINKNQEFELYKDQYRESSKLLEENKKEARRELIQLRTELTTENNKSILDKKRNQLFYIVVATIYYHQV